VGDDESAATHVLKLCKLQAVALTAPVIVVQHINKKEQIAGRMSDQHDVDTVMTFFAEGKERRVLTVEKNRFGEAFISQSFMMTPQGLVVSDDETCDSENDE
jgi:predicted ATP-dependent serine protease